jgi:hypothetical protein
VLGAGTGTGVRDRTEVCMGAGTEGEERYERKKGGMPQD